MASFDPIALALEIRSVVKGAVFPPWRIQHFSGQMKASAKIIFLGTVLVFFVRLIAPVETGDYALISNILISVIPLIIALVISAFAPRLGDENIGIWMNFVGVSFFYSLLIVIVFLYLVPIVFGLDKSPMDYFVHDLKYPGYLCYLSLAFVSSLLATSFMYIRKKLWFSQVEADTARELVLAFLGCVVGLGVLVFVTTFVQLSL